MPKCGPDEKWCSGCRAVKSKSEFSLCQSQVSGGVCRKCVNERHAAYIVRHPESYKESQRETTRKYMLSHPEKGRAWRQANLTLVCEYQRKRHAQQRGLPGSHTLKEWRALCEKFDHRCVCCGEKRPLTRGHMIPVTRPGSSDSITNIQPLCAPCNSSKHRQVMDYRDHPFVNSGTVKPPRKRILG